MTQYPDQSQATSIADLRMQEGFSWCSELPLSTTVQVYGAVMARNEILVNVGDYVAFKSEDSPTVILHYEKMKGIIIHFSF